MSLPILTLVLFAALLHASWNALLRSGADRLWSMTMMCIGVAVASVVIALFLAPPARESWVYAGVSGLLHVGYNLFLVRTYEAGELGQTYPISRGSSPILITVGAAVFAGERVGGSGLLGIFLVSSGIMSLALLGRRLPLSSLSNAIATGCFIAAYSVTDGLGVRLSGAPFAYTAWMCTAWGVMMPLVYIVLRDAASLFKKRPGIPVAMVGGLVSLVAYGIVVFAMSHAPMGAVSALRETSVVFAALIGYFFLGEALTMRKMVSCAVIALGTLVLG